MIQFQSIPMRFSTKVKMPIDGANRNAHSTPATAAATAYGQISSVLYTSAPRTTPSAMVASISDIAMPKPATRTLKTAVTLNESR